MANLEAVRKLDSNLDAGTLPVSVIIAARNEAKNLPRCLQALKDFGEVYVIDSQSKDATVEIARSHGAQVAQFHYQGGWPKKRQWAMDTLPVAHEWVLLLDADEVLTPLQRQRLEQARASDKTVTIRGANEIDDPASRPDETAVGQTPAVRSRISQIR